MKPEHELILELCRFIQPDKDKVKLLMTDTLQWPYVLGQLLFHRMGGVAYHVLRECNLLGQINREIRNALKTIYDSAVLKTESMKRVLDDLTEILSAVKFPYALLKGSYLMTLYLQGLRVSNDMDILIRSCDITELEQSLKSHGFRQGHIRSGTFVPANRVEILSSRMNRGETVPYIKRIELPGMEYWEIDINFSLDYKPSQGDDFVDSFLQHVQPLIVTSYGALPTLDSVHFLIHLCCHLYKEASTYAWVAMDRDLSLYKFSDLHLLLSNWNDAVLYHELQERIISYSLQKECYYALFYSCELFKFKNELMNQLLQAIQPQDTCYLNAIIDPEHKKLYRYHEKFVDWLFLSGRKERLYEIENETP